MKVDYLSKLRSLLDLYVMENNEKEDIVNDYSEMYDNWIEYGMSEEDVESKLGEPKSIIGELVEGYKRIKSSNAPSHKNDKIIAVTPFIALVIFFVLGFGFDGWAYSWVAFLIIPITAITVEMSGKKNSHMVTALSPFIVSLTYLYIGFFHDLWHPGWLVFLAIPIVAIFTEKKSIGFLNTIVSLSPFAALIAFFILGEQNLWVPGWLVFLGIPMIAVLNEKKIGKVILWEAMFIIGIGGYLYVGYTFEEWGFALLAFVPLVLFAISQDEEGFKTMPKEYRLISLFAILLYVALGLTLNLWGYAWLVFFIIPLYAINKEVEGNAKIIAFMPFIATAIFFTLGWFFGFWAFAWMAFLIIPVVAIILEA